jgi:hypothetical protein
VDSRTRIYIFQRFFQLVGKRGKKRNKIQTQKVQENFQPRKKALDHQEKTKKLKHFHETQTNIKDTKIDSNIAQCSEGEIEKNQKRFEQMKIDDSEVISYFDIDLSRKFKDGLL